MRWTSGPRDGYSSPKKGSKRRLLVNLMLRKQGIMMDEAADHGMKYGSFHGAIEALRSGCGFDIRIVSYFKPPGVGRPRGIYRIVGRHYWDGRYRSLLESNKWMREKKPSTK